MRAQKNWTLLGTEIVAVTTTPNWKCENVQQNEINNTNFSK